jgi:hypothetical protein
MSAALLLLLLVPLARDLFHDKGRKVAESQEKKEYLDKFFFFFLWPGTRFYDLFSSSRPTSNNFDSRDVISTVKKNLYTQYVKKEKKKKNK